MEPTTEFLHETALFVQEYYATEFSGDYCFHNFTRTGNIARNAVTLGVQMGLNKEEADNCIRFSYGKKRQKPDIEKLAEIILSLYK